MTEATESKATPDELVSSLLDGAPGEVFDFIKTKADGTRVVVPIRVELLRIEQNHEAIQASQEYAKGRELGGYGDIYREAQAIEVVTRALRHVNKLTRADGTEFYPRRFTDSRQVRASFTEPELAVLLNCYQIVKSKHGALNGIEEGVDAESWIAKLGDPLRGPFFLSQLDSLHWPAMILLLAGVARDLLEASGYQLPNSQDISESAQSNSTLDTGDSSTQHSASLKADPDVTVGPEKILSADEAREILRKRRTKPAE